MRSRPGTEASAFAYRKLLALVLLALMAPRIGAASTAKAFDELAERFDRAEVIEVDTPRVAQELARLKAMLPAADAGRRRNFDGQVCMWDQGVTPETGMARALAGVRDARAAGDRIAEARFEYCRGIWSGVAGDPGAEAAFTRGIMAARRGEDALFEAWGYTHRGEHRSIQGRHAHALHDLFEAQRLFEKARDAHYSQVNLINIGLAYRRLGDSALALRYLKDGQAYARRSNKTNTLRIATIQLGWALEENGRPREALAYFAEALRLRNATPTQRMYPLSGMTDAYLSLGEGERALAAILLARRDLSRDIIDGDPMLDCRLGRSLAAVGRHAEAMQYFNAAEPRMRRSGLARYLEILLQARSISHEALGNSRDALADLREAQRVAKRLNADAQTQVALLERIRFESVQRDAERTRLATEAATYQKQVQLLERERLWRGIAAAFAVLLAVMGGLIGWRYAHKARRFKASSLTDPLTGLPNRRALMAMAHADAEQADARGLPVCAAYVDLDHFKSINDRYGHAGGDEALKAVAVALQDGVRGMDQVGRMGGEEFLVLLPGSDEAEAVHVLGRLRQAVARADLSAIDRDLRVTASIGVAERKRHEPVDAWLNRADAALYAAKAAGRNRIERSTARAGAS